MRSGALSMLLASLALVACADRPEPADAPRTAATPTPATPTPATPTPATPAPEPAARGAHQSVNLPLGDDLPKLLAEHVALAKKAGLTPYVELWAEWCPPCKKLEAAMGDPRIVKAFAGVYLIRLDSDQWGPKLEGTGLANGSIPVFYELDDQGKATGRKVDGSAWEEDIPENMAPPLDAFFHAKKP
jgi:thiol-disulfide isomerase/thioredoxin